MLVLRRIRSALCRESSKSRLNGNVKTVDGRNGANLPIAVDRVDKVIE